MDASISKELPYPDSGYNNPNNLSGLATSNNAGVVQQQSLPWAQMNGSVNNKMGSSGQTIKHQFPQTCLMNAGSNTSYPFYANNSPSLPGQHETQHHNVNFYNYGNNHPPFINEAPRYYGPNQVGPFQPHNHQSQQQYPLMSHSNTFGAKMPGPFYPNTNSYAAPYIQMPNNPHAHPNLQQQYPPNFTPYMYPGTSNHPNNIVQNNTFYKGNQIPYANSVAVSDTSKIGMQYHQARVYNNSLLENRALYETKMQSFTKSPQHNSNTNNNPNDDKHNNLISHSTPTLNQLLQAPTQILSRPLSNNIGNTDVNSPYIPSYPDKNHRYMAPGVELNSSNNNNNNQQHIPNSSTPIRYCDNGAFHNYQNHQHTPNSTLGDSSNGKNGKRPFQDKLCKADNNGKSKKKKQLTDSFRDTSSLSLENSMQTSNDNSLMDYPQSGINLNMKSENPNNFQNYSQHSNDVKRTDLTNNHSNKMLSSPDQSNTSFKEENSMNTASPSSWTAKQSGSPGCFSSSLERPPHIPIKIKKNEPISRLYEFGNEPDRKFFLDHMLKFNEQNSNPIPYIPTVSKAYIDLYKLYHMVKERGGTAMVNQRKQWREIAAQILDGHSASASFNLRKQYIKCLLNYECKFDLGGVDPAPIIAQIEATVKKKRKKPSGDAQSSTTDREHTQPDNEKRQTSETGTTLHNTSPCNVIPTTALYYNASPHNNVPSMFAPTINPNLNSKLYNSFAVSSSHAAYQQHHQNYGVSHGQYPNNFYGSHHGPPYPNNLLTNVNAKNPFSDETGPLHAAQQSFYSPHSSNNLQQQQQSQNILNNINNNTNHGPNISHSNPIDTVNISKDSLHDKYGNGENTLRNQPPTYTSSIDGSCVLNANMSCEAGPYDQNNSKKQCESNLETNDGIISKLDYNTNVQERVNTQRDTIDANSMVADPQKQYSEVQPSNNQSDNDKSAAADVIHASTIESQRPLQPINFIQTKYGGNSSFQSHQQQYSMYSNSNPYASNSSILHSSSSSNNFNTNNLLNGYAPSSSMLPNNSAYYSSSPLSNQNLYHQKNRSYQNYTGLNVTSNHSSFLPSQFPPNSFPPPPYMGVGGPNQPPPPPPDYHSSVYGIRHRHGGVLGPSLPFGTSSLYSGQAGFPEHALSDDKNISYPNFTTTDYSFSNSNNNYLSGKSVYTGVRMAGGVSGLIYSSITGTSCPTPPFYPGLPVNANDATNYTSYSQHNYINRFHTPDNKVISFGHPFKEENNFNLPYNVVETISVKYLRLRKLQAREIGSAFDMKKMILALRSGIPYLIASVLDTFTIFLNDESKNGLFHLSHYPSILNLLLTFFEKCLRQIYRNQSSTISKQPENTSSSIDYTTGNELKCLGEKIKHGKNYTWLSRRKKVVGIAKGAIIKTNVYHAASTIINQSMNELEMDDMQNLSFDFNFNHNLLFHTRTQTPSPNNNNNNIIKLDRPRPQAITEPYLYRFCLCLSNIFRSLSFLPFNDMSLAKSERFLKIAIRLILLSHKTNNSDKTNVTRQHESVDLYQRDCWLALSKDMLVILSNLSGKIDLSLLSDECISDLFHGLIHTLLCNCSYTSNNYESNTESSQFDHRHEYVAWLKHLSPNIASNLPTPRNIIVLEIFTKLLVSETNLDYCLAVLDLDTIEQTINFCIECLAYTTGNHHDIMSSAPTSHTLYKEMVLILLSMLAVGDTSNLILNLISQSTHAIPAILGFLEEIEANASRIIHTQGFPMLRDNPELMGTSLAMLRRCANLLLALATRADDKSAFISVIPRLLTLVMSQILDQNVANIIANILFIISANSNNMTNVLPVSKS